jgi:hypothetical protein
VKQAGMLKEALTRIVICTDVDNKKNTDNTVVVVDDEVAVNEEVNDTDVDNVIESNAMILQEDPIDTMENFEFSNKIRCFIYSIFNIFVLFFVFYNNKKANQN